ncbi:MAG: 2-hydroxychromene-2-carboxylate isomerase [Polyangiaceae bacterium]
MAHLDFYFDYSSPFAYLGATQVGAVAKRHDAQLNLEPFFLGGLFKSIGTPLVPFAEMPQPKQKLAMKDMYRWAEYWDVPFNFPSRFPMNTIAALRMTLQLSNDAMEPFMLAVFRAYWGEDRDINAPDVLQGLAADLGLDGTALLEGCQNPAIKDKLKAATEGAAEAGLVGAPTFVVREGDEAGVMFWGQDRLLMVEKALDGWRPKSG